MKLAAITPIGTVSMVPTCEKRACRTPRRTPQTPGKYITLDVIGESTIDPLFTTAIYLDRKGSGNQNYNYVAERMRSITAQTISLQKRYSTEIKPMINISGKVPQHVFDQVLLLYENNQVYYQDCIDNQNLQADDIKVGLTQLEQWFMCIIEPRPTDNADTEAWKNRELMKLATGISSYCDPELHSYIRPLPPDIRTAIIKYQSGLF